MLSNFIIVVQPRKNLELIWQNNKQSLHKSHAEITTTYFWSANSLTLYHPKLIKNVFVNVFQCLNSSKRCCQAFNKSRTGLHLEHWCRGHSVYVPRQWEMTLHCNVISHWLGTCTKLSLLMSTTYDIYNSSLIFNRNSVSWFFLHLQTHSCVSSSRFLEWVFKYQEVV